MSLARVGVIQVAAVALACAANSNHRVTNYWTHGRNMSSSSEATCAARCKTLSEWNFSSPRLADLPIDKQTDNVVRSHVAGAVFSVCRPTPLKTERKLIAVSEDALAELDMDVAIADDPDFVDFVAGNKILPSSVPLSHRYGGFQFGLWASQLGDGRAHLLGERVNEADRRWELQLKGSGRTPYSRFGDGRAVIRSSVREFVCSEAMFYLGVPTSRAAAIVTSNDPVVRDMFYDGNARTERAAVVLRMAPTWFRFGSLEILAKNEELAQLRKLVDTVIGVNFPHIAEADPQGGSSGDWYLALFAEVVAATARMVAHWMAVGYVHGVMNTDNMSLASVTIDYGPFGFVEAYDPDFIPNSSDDSGRYDLKSQPRVALWNLQRLAQSISLLLDASKRSQLQVILNTYNSTYEDQYWSLFRAKLGLRQREDEASAAKDKELLEMLLSAMERRQADFTQTFRDLSETSLSDLREGKTSPSAWALAKLLPDASFRRFLEQYASRLEEDYAASTGGDGDRMAAMQAANPAYVLRNWMAQKAIERAEEDDFEEVRRLLRVLKRPFVRQVEAEKAGYGAKPPNWARDIRVSCSS